MIRSFMKTTFPIILNILFVLSFIGVFIFAIAGASMFGGGFSFMTFLFTLMMGGMGVVLTFGVLYILLDIRDAVERKQ